MVKIAIAGGTGNVASEIVDALVATKKHEVLILSRKEPSAASSLPGVSYAKTDYRDVKALAEVFKGTHTVLSFLAPFDQEDGIKSQTCIIDACVAAGVKRFAPSEWVSAGLDHMPWYTFKGAARQYLAELNRSSKVLEYCLFQPGYFTDYLGNPSETTKHIQPIETPWDLPNRRMLVAEGSEDVYTSWTTVKDFRNVICRAVEYEGEWPVVGGIRGSRMTMNEVLKVGEKVRGGSKFTVETIPVAELEAQSFNTSWVPKIEHPSIPPEAWAPMAKMFTSGILLAVKARAFDISDEWNKLLPDYEFESAEGFLGEVWKGKE